MIDLCAVCCRSELERIDNLNLPALLDSNQGSDDLHGNNISLEAIALVKVRSSPLTSPVPFEVLVLLLAA